MLRLSFLAALALAIPTQTSNYDQPFRPQVHFSPLKNWTNDPNGLVFFHGEYHLFYQFNPFGNQWGHMSWGHAVSTDPLHWTELPVAIPEQGGEMVFTGSVVVDHQNSSGLCAPKPECLIAVYTGHRESPKPVQQTQNLAYSVDDGRTFNRYVGNPVLDLHLSDFRDPSVSWDDDHHRWVMAVSLAAERKISFYSSPNLKQWTHLSDFGPAGDVGGVWECPDLLRMPNELDATQSIWALKVGLNPGAPNGGSGEQYFLGNFDGTRFIPSTEPGAHGWTNYGKDDYCAISFNNLRSTERPILIGWMNNWQYADKLPTDPWRGQMSIPRRLSFFRDQAGLAIKQDPVITPLRELTSYFPLNDSTKAKSIDPPFELDFRYSGSSSKVFGVRLVSDAEHYTEIAFDPANHDFYVDRTHSGENISPDFAGRTTAPLISTRPMNLRIIVDRSSIEVFAQDGTIAMTNLFFPPTQSLRVLFFRNSANATTAPQLSGAIYKLSSIWK